MQSQDREPNEADLVIRSQHTLFIHIHMKNLVQRRKSSYFPRTRSCLHNPIETRPAKRRSRRNQPKRSVLVLARSQIYAAAPVTRKGHLHARIGFSRDLGCGIEARVNHFSSRSKPSQPSGVHQFSAAAFPQLHNFARHPLGHFHRRNREIQLIHFPANEFHQQPQNEFPGQVHFAPYL